MKKLSISWTVKKIVQNIDKSNILFNHPIQRKPEQWTKEQKSLLIHSLLSDYPIPPLYAIKDIIEDNKYSILDGKQRLTEIRSFIKDEWRLINDTPEVVVEGVEYEIAGLKYSQLPQELKDELGDANLLIYIFEDCSEEEIEEVFYRLNNGTALTKDQKTRAKLGNELAKYVDEVLELDFFKEKAHFTTSQIRKSEDQTCILQTLILLSDYKFATFNNVDMIKFFESNRDNFDISILEMGKSLFIKLNEAFEEKHKLIKKVNIPMFVMVLKTSEDMEIPFEKFKSWINYFINNYDMDSEYNSYCTHHTTGKEAINKRLDLLYNSLIEYAS